MKRLTREIWNPPLFEDPEKTRIAGLLNTILLSFIAFAIGYVILAPWLYREPQTVFVSGLVATVLWFAAWRLLHRGHIQLAGALFLIVLFIIVSAVAFTRGGLHAAAVTTYITIIFAAGLLLGRPAAVVFAFLCLITGLGMLWTELAGLLPGPKTGTEPASAWIGLATNVVLALMLLSLAVSNITTALERVRNQERELARSNRELESEVAERRRAEQALRKSEERYRTILESIEDGYFEVDLAGNMIFFNDALCRIIGYPHTDLLGMNNRDYMDPENARRAYETFHQVYLTGKPSKGFDWELIREDGTRRYIEASVSLILTDGGQPVGFRGIARDITERKQAEKALRQRTQELQERNQDLSAFAHTVAHDLRAPLGLIIGLAEFLEYDQALMTGDELRRHLQTIIQHGVKMDSLIENLLLLAQVREIDFHPEPLDMLVLVAEAYNRLDALVKERGAELAMPATLPWALGYGPWIEQVWVNYLSNAIKYGGRPPHIEVGAEVQPDGMIRFWVEDNGRGITPEKQAHLFVPFARLGELYEMGHGLGLSIALRIVARLGGEVGVESDGVPGHGSRFYFTLPGDAASAG